MPMTDEKKALLASALFRDGNLFYNALVEFLEEEKRLISRLMSARPKGLVVDIVDHYITRGQLMLIENYLESMEAVKKEYEKV
jgi:hypothetical protein